MQIEILKLGVLQTNCYILKKDNKCIIIDPGAEFNKIDEQLTNPIAVLITHHHFDHTSALDELLYKYNIPIYSNKNLIEKTHELDEFKFDVIHTPGHSDDSVVYYFKDEQVMFTGDFLFRKTIGRTDLETSDVLAMANSIEKIKSFPDDIKIYPGHGESSNLGYEKVYNDFLNGNLKAYEDD